MSSTSDEVVVLAFINQVATRDKDKTRVDGSRVRVTLTRVNDRWKIREFVPV